MRPRRDFEFSSQGLRVNFLNVAMQDSAGEPSSKRVLTAIIIGYSLLLISLESLNVVAVSGNAYSLLQVLGSAALASIASEWFSGGYRAVNSEIP